MQESDQLSLAEPARIAVIYDNDARITYGRFARDVSDLAAWLHGQGLTPGKRVGIFLRHSYWEWIANLAAMRLGLSVVTLTKNHADEIAAIAGIDVWLGEPVSPAQTCITFSPPTMAPLREQMGIGDGDPTAANQPSWRYMTTSGTTGRTKAVRWDEDTLRKNVQVVRDSQEIDRDTVMLVSLGMDTTIGFRYPIAAWQAGGCVLMRKTLPGTDQSLLTLKSLIASNFIAASPQRLMNILSSFPKKWDGRAERKVVVPGGRLPIAARNRALEIACGRISMAYGATESGSIAVGDSLLFDRHPGAVGFALEDAAVDVVGSDDVSKAPGEPGIVRTRTSYMTRRYEGDVEGAGTFRDGWFYPGDEGILYPDGMLAITGRISETFNLMGLKVSIADLEAELLQTPSIVDVAAVMINLKGVDHLAIAVVCDKRQDAIGVGNQVRRKIPQGIPMRVARVRQIPRNAMGKVVRQELKTHLTDFFSRKGKAEA